MEKVILEISSVEDDHKYTFVNVVSKQTYKYYSKHRDDRFCDIGYIIIAEIDIDNAQSSKNFMVIEYINVLSQLNRPNAILQWDKLSPKAVEQLLTIESGDKIKYLGASTIVQSYLDCESVDGTFGLCKGVPHIRGGYDYYYAEAIIIRKDRKKARRIKGCTNKWYQLVYDDYFVIDRGLSKKDIHRHVRIYHMNEPNEIIELTPDIAWDLRYQDKVKALKQELEDARTGRVFNG